MLGRNLPLEQTPHLASALAALILGVVALEAFGFYARSLEYRSITGLAANDAIIERAGKLDPVKNQGTALQEAAVDSSGLLPVYGSSELNLLAEYTRPFHPTILFRDCPTGFRIFPLGKAETTSVIILQTLAAVGPGLQGRKVAVSLSPYWFFKRLTARPDAYAGNFSDLHAGELAFHTRLSLKLRQDAARRMLQFPATVANRPLLRFALENLADGSPLSVVCYNAVLPLGMMHNAVLRYQDHWSVVCYLWKHPPKASTPNSPRRLRRWIGRCCTSRQMHCTVLIPIITNSVSITKSGTANSARKPSSSETAGRRRRFSATWRRARNGTIWSFFCVN